VGVGFVSVIIVAHISYELLEKRLTGSLLAMLWKEAHTPPHKAENSKHVICVPVQGSVQLKTIAPVPSIQTPEIDKEAPEQC